MYEQFGACVSQDKNANGLTSVTFKVFFPNESQFVSAAGPRIVKMEVLGDFQSNHWDKDSALPMVAEPHEVEGSIAGTLFHATVELPDGFYEYEYSIEFENRTKTQLGDPISRYGSPKNDHSAFVVGGRPRPPLVKLQKRLPLSELIIYELMIDDFTAELEELDSGQSPIEAVGAKLTYLKEELGVNAIAFMPWTAWPANEFSWGYNPSYYFSVESRYTNSTSQGALEKLSLLRELINKCHDKGLHVIMDGVFNHTQGNQKSGFPYIGMYEQEFESPFIGTFSGGGFFKDLDFNNECTHQFVFDVCRYWIKEFGIDGIRFDYTTGFYHWDDRGHGLHRLLFDIKHYLRNENEENFALILEHLSDNRFDAINVANQVGASACWFDPMLFLARDGLKRYREKKNDPLKDENKTIVATEWARILNSSKDFGKGRGPINYIENHDHSRIAHEAGERDCWRRTQPYAIALFTISGTPMIYNGQEFAIDDSDNVMPETGTKRVQSRPVKWEKSNDHTGQEMFKLYRKLIQIRKDHPAFRSSNIIPDTQEEKYKEPNPEGYGISCSKNMAIYQRFENGPDGKPLTNYVVVLNFDTEIQKTTIKFPCSGKWEDLLNDFPFHVDDNDDRRHEIEVDKCWGRVLRHIPNS
ncbi:MAG: 1,4-alpha-glucan branching enzyme [Deltaproteobacteria bacterium]|nr:1,4-alpha-glucan branching enzyme [Deltaproteobacteria bacterium]